MVPAIFSGENVSQRAEEQQNGEEDKLKSESKCREVPQCAGACALRTGRRK